MLSLTGTLFGADYDALPLGQANAEDARLLRNKPDILLGHPAHYPYES